MPDAAKPLTLPPSPRLGGSAAFPRLFDSGTKATRGPLTLYLLPNDLGHPRLGLTVGRRVGNAVRRNRHKRLLREAFRHLQHDLPPADLVIVVRPHEPMSPQGTQEALRHLVNAASQRRARH